MNTNQLKKFAQEARRKLLQQVGAKLEFVLTHDTAELREKAAQVNNLKDELNRIGKQQLIDKVAYTWFNRLMALRFMDANDYQPSGIRIVSPKDGFTLPQILDEAKQGHFPEDISIDKQKVLDILDGRLPSNNPQNEAYRVLLVAACNALHRQFPFLFERINDYTELLLPDDLTSEFSIVNDIVHGMNKEDCQQVEIIGWLYQFYISELNEQLISSKKKYKKEELAPASQLFTPRWIVEYMVDNTLGQLWTEINPSTKITDSLKYYIKPNDLDVLPSCQSKSVEEVKFFEPCLGSGHILSYAFDVFYKIYEEQGYSPSQIPSLILSKNLWGVDIDERAAQMAAFVLIMKGREKYRRFFRQIEKGEVKIHIYHYEDFDFDLKFKNAKALGSLINVDPGESKKVNVDTSSIFRARQEKLRSLYMLLENQYDVVVTNPPYVSSSRMEGSLKQYVEENYSDTKSDLFATFVVRCLELCKGDGLTGYMTPFVWMFISSYQKLREKIIDNHFINNLIQLEYSGFDGATVPVCTFTIRKKKNDGFKSRFIRLTKFKGADLQAPKTLEAIRNPECGWLYTFDQNEFNKIPEDRFGYWLSNLQIEAFARGDELKKSYPPKAGLSTANNDRFLRFWYEVSNSKIDFSCTCREDLKKARKWIPMTKGGKFRKWYGNNEYVLNWDNDGAEIKHWLVNNPNDPSTNSWSRYVRNYDSYCKPGISFSDVSSGTPAFRKQPDGYIPNARGPFIYSDSSLLLGYLNSKICVSFLELLSPTLTFNVGDISKVPFLNISNNRICDLSDECYYISKNEWDTKEISWDFNLSGLIRHKATSLEECYDLFYQYWTNKIHQLHRNEQELNQQFIEIYGLQEELTPDVPLEDITILKEETSIENGKLIFQTDEILAQFVSYAVGCMFGRYSLDKEGLILANQGETMADYVRKALGDSELAISEGQELTANSQQLKAKIPFLPDDDAIIPVLDDEWFEDDVVGRFYEFLKVTYGERDFQKNLAFVEEALGKDIRKYFVKEFYNDHIKRYKKRPIYWMFSSPKGSFNVLVYLHRYTPDTLNNILNNYLREFIQKLQSQKSHYERILVSGNTREQNQATKQIDKLEKMILDCEEYEREILYPLATERISIDLDDGVLVNYNKFGKAVKEVKGLNDKKAKEKVMKFDWIDTSKII